MPAARNGRRQQPVTLRDFLEFGCDSSSDGFRSYPRCYPCDALALHSSSNNKAAAAAAPEAIEEELRRSPSWSPSAFLFPNKSQGSALARISSTLSRSFSRRITTFSFSFWSSRRREDDDDYFDDDRDSCAFFPSPLVSSCSSFSSSSSSSELLQDIVIQEPPVFDETSASATSSSEMPGAAGHGHQAEALDAGGDDPAAVGRRKLETMEDKQQLSPVSVLDFPLDDDDGDEEERSDVGTCSPSCFHHHHNCAATIQQRKKQKSQQMLHKARRFDDDGQTAEEAVVVDLEARFITTTTSSDLPSNSTDDSEAADTPSTASRHEHHDDEEHQSIEQSEEEEGQQDHHHETEPDDDDHDEYPLLARLLDNDDDDKKAAVIAVDEITEWLLLDFFAEGMDRLRSSVVIGTTTAYKLPLLHDDDVNNNKAMTAALDWLRGAGPQWGIGDVMFSGESALKDMERGRRWMCAREEEQDVGAEVEAFVIDFLVDELVTELIGGGAATVDHHGTIGTVSS